MTVKIKYLVFCLLFVSCKSYMEYSMGTKELSYSFDKRLKRFDDLEEALKNVDNVFYLDIDVSYSDSSDRTLKKLNDQIHQFTNLKKLTISGKGGVHNFFPRNIFKQTSIEFLAISNFNKLQLSDLSEIRNLRELKFLALSYCCLTSLPPSLFSLNQLEGLDLTLNKLSDLPEEFVQLKNIRTVDLTNNCLKNIPESLLSCERLEWLDLNNAEGTEDNELDVMHNCYNECHNIETISKFKSLRGLSLFKVFDKITIKELDAKHPSIKID